jgi:hypothetical protein
VAGVSLLLLPQKIESPQYQVIGKWRDDFLMVNNAASPDMRWVGQSVDYPDAPSILNVLAQPHSGWREKVYLEKTASGLYLKLDPPTRSIPLTLPEKGSRLNNRAALKDSFTKPGFVIFDESFAPGWHAWVDGKPQPIFRADGLFMAAPLSAGGSHQVDFRYEPTTFRFGLFISLISLGLLCGGICVRRHAG